MTQEQAEHVMRRFQALGWRSEVWASEFDREEWYIEASDGEAAEFYTCRKFLAALELLAILRGRAVGLRITRKW